MYWIAIHLPELALQVFQRGTSQPEALAVSEGKFILAASDIAQRLGVRCGMSLPSACAMAPGLLLKSRAQQRERAALQEIAIWAGQFTPQLALAPPDTVMLEVEASLRLFGGIDALMRQIADGCAALGFQWVAAAAPTAMGAQLLAGARKSMSVGDLAELNALLAELPVQFLDIAPTLQQSLASFGVKTLGDCLRLPRDGLARRCGPGLMQKLDRACGRLPDPRPWFQPPPHFSARIELAWSTESTDPILFVAKRLLVTLEGFLAARFAGIEHFQIELEHEDIAATQLTISFSSRCREATRLLGVLREQLARLVLAAPVLAVTLAADNIQPILDVNRGLFADAQEKREPCARLLERLRARLGEEAVTGVRAVPAHRPEFAWQAGEPGTGQHLDLDTLCSNRPLWLLQPPQSLQERNALPQWDGPVALLAGPERIESGWWDGTDCSRDYYLAAGPRNELLWIFRERRQPQSWYLHGLFA